jgi:hypothetical protein
MKHVKLFEEFSELLEMKSDITPVLRKSLDDLGKGFENEEEIVEAILKLGFQKTSSKRSDYIFIDPDRKVKYSSTKAGYVRYYDPNATYWADGEPITTKTPIHSSIIPSSKDRLLLILRRAMKVSDLYKSWKKTNLTVKEFLEKSRGTLAAKRFRI